MADEIVNKVAKSGLISLDLEDLYPQGERAVLDIKDQLWQGIALKEKDFRTWVKEHDWSVYQDQYVAVHCSVDAIVPTWAYMLVAAALSPFAKKVVFGDLEVLQTVLFEEVINGIDAEDYRDARIVIKGCGDLDVPPSAYVALTNILVPVARSVMYGEPCSTVPLYKRPRKK